MITLGDEHYEQLLASLRYETAYQEIPVYLVEIIDHERSLIAKTFEKIRGRNVTPERWQRILAEAKQRFQNIFLPYGTPIGPKIVAALMGPIIQNALSASHSAGRAAASIKVSLEELLRLTNPDIPCTYTALTLVDPTIQEVYTVAKTMCNPKLSSLLGAGYEVTDSLPDEIQHAYNKSRAIEEIVTWRPTRVYVYTIALEAIMEYGGRLDHLAQVIAEHFKCFVSVGGFRREGCKVYVFAAGQAQEAAFRYYFLTGHSELSDVHLSVDKCAYEDFNINACELDKALSLQDARVIIHEGRRYVDIPYDHVYCSLRGACKLRISRMLDAIGCELAQENPTSTCRTMPMESVAEIASALSKLPVNRRTKYEIEFIGHQTDKRTGKPMGVENFLEHPLVSVHETYTNNTMVNLSLFGEDVAYAIFRRLVAISVSSSKIQPYVLHTVCASILGDVAKGITTRKGKKSDPITDALDQSAGKHLVAGALDADRIHSTGVDSSIIMSVPARYGTNIVSVSIDKSAAIALVREDTSLATHINATRMMKSDGLSGAKICEEDGPL